MKQRHRCAVALIASALSCHAASIASAQPCVAVTQNINCATMPFLAPNQTWVPPLNELDWQPNRLPIALINLRAGGTGSGGMYCLSSTEGNPRGLQSWWYVNDDDPAYAGNTPDAEAAFDALEARLNSAYQAGYRRVRPGSSTPIQSSSTSEPPSQWTR